MKKTFRLPKSRVRARPGRGWAFELVSFILDPDPNPAPVSPVQDGSLVFGYPLPALDFLDYVPTGSVFDQQRMKELLTIDLEVLEAIMELKQEWRVHRARHRLDPTIDQQKEFTALFHKYWSELPSFVPNPDL